MRSLYSSSNLDLDIQSFVFDDPGRKDSCSGLKMTAKRYRPVLSGLMHQRRHNPGSGNANRDPGVTLLFAHCIGAHKEHWEPTIRAIFHHSLLQTSNQAKVKVREAWAFDWQGHGDAAVLNRDVLRKRTDQCVSVYEWAPAISAFMRSEHMKGHRIVLVGHSAGAGAMMLTTKDFSPRESPVTAIILVEPTILTKELFDATIDERMAAMNLSVRSTSKRRDSWPSREEAFIWLSKKYPWKTWDTRIVRLLVDYGMERTSDGVRLKCDKQLEAASYPDVNGHFESATLIRKFGRSLPIHLIWGETGYLPDKIRGTISDASAGYVVASVQTIEGAGHLIVQEKPDAVAQAICHAMDGRRGVSQALQTRL